MFGLYSYNNNAKTTLQSAMTNVATTASLVAAVAPFNNPATDASSSRPAYFTLMDNAVSPTKIEIIVARAVAAPSGGIVALTSVTRGVEGTTAQAWPAGTVVFQGITKAMLDTQFMRMSDNGLSATIQLTNHVTWDRNGFNLDIDAQNIAADQLTANSGGNFICAANATFGGAVTFSTTPSFNLGAVISNGLQLNQGMYCTGAATFAGPTVIDPLGRLVNQKTAPASSSASGSTNEIRWDANYIYVCTAPSTWKRAALTTW